MTQIKKFGLGGLVAALFATMALATLATTAEANVNSLTRSASAVGAGGNSTLTINAQDTDGDLTVTVTGGGTLTAGNCFGVACAATVNDGTAQITIPDAGNNLDLVTVTYNAPATITNPGTATIQAVQDNTSQQTTITLRGDAATIEVSALEAAPTGTNVCNGDAASVIQANGATVGLATAQICVLVKDSAGNALPGVTPIVITTEGTLGAIAATGAASPNLGRTVFTLTPNSTSASGDTATITVTSGTASGTATVMFGGDPASCTFEAPANLGQGSTADVAVSVLDDSDNPSPDNTQVNVDAVHAGTGQNVAVVPGGNQNLENGEATFVVLPAIQGSVALVADATGGTTPNCTGSILVGEPGSTPGEPGDGSFVAEPNFGSGNVGSAVFNGGSIADLADATADAGGTGVWVQGTDGNWYRYTVGATGATAFVNNAFNAQFEDGFAGATAVFVVK